MQLPAARARGPVAADRVWSQDNISHILTNKTSFLIYVLVRICKQTARPEENGVEVMPVDKGSDRGRRAKGGRGEHIGIKTLSVL